MTNVGEYVLHDEPLWRERSNFIINARLAEAYLPRRFEQLFVRQLHEDRFEICCIPFVLYDVALGDIVTTVPIPGCAYVLDEVVERSGRYVFRVWFGDSVTPPEDVADRLRGLGAGLEWASRKHLAIDARDHEHAREIAGFLAAGEAAGHFLYETGRMRPLRPGE